MALPRVEYPAIKKRVRESALSDERVCCELGLSISSLRNKLAGRTEFTLTEALALARLLGTSVEELAGSPREPARLP